MSETNAPISITDQLLALAVASPDRFPIIFRKFRADYPEEVTRACVLHLGEHGLDKAGRVMITWLCVSPHYLSALLDPKLLSLQAAKQAAAVLSRADHECLSRLVSLSERSDSLSARRSIIRALELADVFTNNDVLVPWLRQLTNSPDVRIRSKAVKALCGLRPNRDLIERQLISPDERIRANAVEAIWYQKTAYAEEVLRRAVQDPHYRVFCNGMVGLYLIEDKAVFDQIAKLELHPSPMVRRAMIWTLGFIKDPRGLPILERLSKTDALPAVRHKALKTMERLSSALASDSNDEMDKPEVEEPESIPSAV